MLFSFVGLVDTELAMHDSCLYLVNEHAVPMPEEQKSRFNLETKRYENFVGMEFCIFCVF